MFDLLVEQTGTMWNNKIRVEKIFLAIFRISMESDSNIDKNLLT